MTERFNWKELESLPQSERIARLRERMRDLSGRQLILHQSPDCPADILERFWTQVIKFTEKLESGQPLRKKLSPVAHPDTLNQQELSKALWRLIEELAADRVILCHTDHLSNRDLYTLLYEEVHGDLGDEILLEETYCHFDLVGSGSSEDTELYLKHYADEADREDFRQRWDEPIPDHEDPPYHRDRYLPGR
ncbi:hypothetical protein MYX82_02455 [Acidobacteria bacterium AH-259-D05]|nr:hypothetical protein [Acidobacteria bacterium AH-259-D05]